MKRKNIVEICKALSDLTDEPSAEDLHGAIGLPIERCEEIFDTGRFVRRTCDLSPHDALHLIFLPQFEKKDICPSPIDLYVETYGHDPVEGEVVESFFPDEDYIPGDTHQFRS